MAGDVRLTQFARILGSPSDSDEAAVKAAASASPDRLADALFQEAADSDDVIDTESAVAYMEARLEYLSPLLPDEARDVIRSSFHQRVKAWETAP
jgi:hypothetical protein